MSSKPRRAFEPGHAAKFLVVVDNSTECGRAVRFGARRVLRIGARLIMLSIAEPGDFQHWLGVGDVMRAEADAKASQVMDQFAAVCAKLGTMEPERVFRSGNKAEEILKLIEQDEDIAYLVLAAGTGKDGPGPLVSMLSGRAAADFPVPVVIVPGRLSDAEIDALA